MDQLDIACVIPTHGRPAWLREAIESVLRQTVQPSEIIVVCDDGSVEAERVVAESAQQASGTKLSFLRNPTRPGASGSRNLGASATTAEWLAFLDDDDLWAPQMLEHSVALIRPGIDCVVTWLQMFRGQDEAPGLLISPSLKAPAVAGRNPGFTGSNFVMRRSAFEALGGFDDALRVVNDRDLVYRFLLAGHQYDVNPRPEVLQRRHEQDQLTRATEFRAQGLEQYMRKHRETLTRSDVRAMKLAAHRIRYHAAQRGTTRIKHLVLGALNSSPTSVRESFVYRHQRTMWDRGR